VDNDRLILALVQSQNEAADDVLLEGLRRGAKEEQPILLAALFRRNTVRGLSGVIAMYDALPHDLQLQVVGNVRQMHHALRECGRSEDLPLRMVALRLIALGRQGKLAYVLSENLRSQHDDLSKAAVSALVALARWVSNETRWLQQGGFKLLENENTSPPPAGDGAPVDEGAEVAPIIQRDAVAIYNELLAQRPEIEAAIARAIDLSRGRYGPELLRAALLLCDWPGSKTLAILQTAKHGGQTAMVRKLEQPPAAETVPAYLLSASHGQLRSHFGTVFAHISEGPVLEALLRKTHWLKDSQLQICMHQVTRGAWWSESELGEDVARRDAADAAKIGDWLAASGAHDVVQDDRMERLKTRAELSFAARLRLLRLVAARRRGTSVQFLKGFLSDSDERLARIAARELIRRRPLDYENMLLSKIATMGPSVRQIVSRALGHVGFEQFWNRFDRLDLDIRRNAGRAMLKILPDSVARLTRKLANGSVEERLKAMQMTYDLGLVPALHDTLGSLVRHANPKVRSKAVSVLADSGGAAGRSLLEQVLNDTDPRVRANAIEVLEATQNTQFMPMLAERARSGQQRERANSIKALHRMQVGPASDALLGMLQDQRPDHRVSGLWALRQMGYWRLLGEVGRLAKSDANVRVRRYALDVLKGVAQSVQRNKEKAG
jgi:HEAT repeat protein